MPRNLAANCWNCTCDFSRRAYRARGYCNSCYHLIRFIEDVENWDMNVRQTLLNGDRIPKLSSSSNFLIIDDYSPADFELCRQNTLRQLRQRLDQLREREHIRRREIPVSGEDLEN